jgi:hypothetical protein
MATAVHEHVHVIGFLIWLRLGRIVQFVARLFLSLLQSVAGFWLPSLWARVLRNAKTAAFVKSCAKFSRAELAEDGGGEEPEEGAAGNRRETFQLDGDRASLLELDVAVRRAPRDLAGYLSQRGLVPDQH